MWLQREMWVEHTRSGALPLSHKREEELRLMVTAYAGRDSHASHEGREGTRQLLGRTQATV